MIVNLSADRAAQAIRTSEVRPARNAISVHVSWNRHGFLGLEAGRIARLTEERGPEDAEVQRRVQRIFTISRYDLVVLLLVVADMVIKPGL